MPQIPTITLNNGVDIPQLGFGVWQVEPDEVVGVVSAAFEAGYRHIDTAAMYQNEEGVGEAIADSGIDRDEIFVTTKLDNDAHGYDATLAAFDASLGRLGLDRVDLYLIHWPLPARDLYIDSWRAFEKIYADGRARSIGVSNFQPHHLRRLISETTVVPAVNQIEVHPSLTQTDVRAVNAELGIATEAWTPLGNGDFEATTVTAIADRVGKSPAQVVLRWHLQLGNIVFPKSVTTARIKENADLFDFELTDADMASIGALDAGNRTGPDPDRFSAA